MRNAAALETWHEQKLEYMREYNAKRREQKREYMREYRRIRSIEQRASL